MAKIYGYIRGSTGEQEITLEVQKSTIEREYAYRFKDDPNYEWGGYFVDKGVKSKIPLRQRPEGSKVVLILKKGDYLIIAKLDRGFRNSRDLFESLDYFTEHGIGLRLCDLGLDPLSLIGRMIVGLLGVVAEFEKGMIGLRTKEALDEKKRKGFVHVGKSPYGCKKGGGTKGNRRWVPDPYTRAMGAKFLAWFEAGWSAEKIYIHCLKPGVRLKTRLGKEWSLGAIKRAIAGEKKLQAIEANLIVEGCINQPGEVKSPDSEPPTTGEDHGHVQGEAGRQGPADDERLPPAMGEPAPGGPQP
jgi:putative DNA-invertase from lambdoid prophage Rac